EDDHPRVEAALLGEVAPGDPRQGSTVGAVPADLAAVRGKDAEGDPHRRRLAGAVRAEEPEDLAGRDVERQPVEGDHGSEGLVEAVDLERHRARMPADPARRPRTIVPGHAMMTR